MTVGAYRYIRHPLYASLVCLGWGAFFKDVTLLGFLLVVAMSAFLTATAKVEEAENLRKFGDSYAAYMKKTKMVCTLSRLKSSGSKMPPCQKAILSAQFPDCRPSGGNAWRLELSASLMWHSQCVRGLVQDEESIWP